MKISRIALSGLAGSVVMFGLGAIGHSVILKDFREGVLRQHPNLPAIYGGILVLALLMTYLHSISYRGDSRVIAGLRIGILVALLWTIPGGLVRFGAQQGISMVAVLLDSAWHVIEEGLGGVVVALVYSGTKRGPETE
jgi:hypothetical protein